MPLEALAKWIGAIMVILAVPAAADKKRVQPVSVAAGVSPEPVTMKTVNRRWKEARCQVRFGAEIAKGKDRAGWSRSKWLLAPSLPGDRKLFVRLWVSDRALLDRQGLLRRSKFIRPGTPFIAAGWSYREPANQKHLILELRFRQAPVQARLEFRNTRAIDLEDVERIARVELFQLLAAPAPSPVRAAQPSRPVAAAPRPTAQPVRAAPYKPRAGQPASSEGPLPLDAGAVYRPSIQVVAASVKPARASRGSQITLLIQYAVNGLPPGTNFEVTERRILKLGEKTLGDFEEKLPRAIGSYTSAQQIDIPDTAAPGIYSFQAEVSLIGLTGRASALFEIQ